MKRFKNSVCENFSAIDQSFEAGALNVDGMIFYGKRGSWQHQIYPAWTFYFSANTKHGFSDTACVWCVWCFIVLNCVCQDCFGLTQAKLVLSCGLILAPIKIFEGSPAYKLLDVHYASCYGWFIQQTMVEH